MVKGKSSSNSIMPNFPIVIFLQVLFAFATTAHHCNRKCEFPAKPQTCEYDFTIAYYLSMASNCADCPYNTTHCYENKCMSLDGTQRAVVAINEIIPGPAIEVCHYDTIVIHLSNELMTSEVTSLHFHFQRHAGTPYMDGAPMVTQCPIQYGNKWRYEFTADPVGTHFWHSHAGFQRADGAYGALIVREPENFDPLLKFYDFDESEHTILLADWTNELAVSVILTRIFVYEARNDDNILINGRAEGKGNSHDPKTPRSTFSVKPGFRYRFRLIFNGNSDCPIYFSIDYHILTVISTDGNPVEPYQTDILGMSNGERFDVVIATDQDIDNYWIRAKGIEPDSFDLLCPNISSTAILHYDGAPEDNLPIVPLNFTRKGTVLNDPHKPKTDQFIPITALRSLAPNDATSGKADVTYYLAVNQLIYERSELNFDRTNQIDWIAYKAPSIPLIFKKDDQPIICYYDDVQAMREECDGTPVCQCTYVIKVALGIVVEVVIVNEARESRESHPMHLHGMNYRVVAMEKVTYPLYKSEVKLMDKLGLIVRNLDHPVMKDTVAVPAGGYTILRFHANNPGYWLFHCHIEFHIANGGMGLVFKVGENEDIPDVPADFPRCGNWP
ncbi:uncharacterized protein LOC144453143 [Glandiceps talaboti]